MNDASPRGHVAVLLIAVGGALGAVLRWGVGELSTGAGIIGWSTIAINVSGAFALALLPALPRVRDSPAALLLIGPGLLGGYTTLSAYAGESLVLLLDARPALAAAYVVGTLLGCLAAVDLARRIVPGGPR